MLLKNYHIYYYLNIPIFFSLNFKLINFLVIHILNLFNNLILYHTSFKKITSIVDEYLLK